MLPWLPENVSTFGADIDWLFRVIFWITSIVFIGVQAALFWFIFKYRYDPNRRAVYTHGNNTLEIAWTIAPSLILMVLAVISWGSWRHIKQVMPPSNHPVRVMARQFGFEFTYPGPDGKFDTEDDKTFLDDLNVPVNQVIRLELKSKDVIHSFFVPQLRLKQDAMPGKKIDAWFEATKPGTYEIPCAELCGFGHSGMRALLTVHSAESYAKWVQDKWPAGA